MTIAYLDYNATAPVRPEAAAAVTLALGLCGNASSVHRAGRTARRVIEDARDRLAVRLGATAAGVVFTSGGSEANVLALRGQPGRRVFASAVEHPSVLKSADAILPVDRLGRVDGAALESRLAEDGNRPAIVAVMLANNETGVILPVAEIARIAHRQGAWVHCDAVQALGRMAIDIGALGVDSLSVSAHKIGGPQGAGALVLADGEATLAPLVTGGGQERSRRAGTENLPGIAGFAAALDSAFDVEAVRALRDRLEAEVRALDPDIQVVGAEAPRLCNTSCLAVPGLKAETAVMALDLDGVMVSAGAACSSGKVAQSPVLAAMGLGEMAGQALRVSLGWASRDEDVERFVGAFARLLRGRRERHAA